MRGRGISRATAGRSALVLGIAIIGLAGFGAGLAGATARAGGPVGVTHAPLVLMPTTRAAQFRAGFVQHRPTNLGSLFRRRSGSPIRVAAAARPPVAAPTILSYPANPTSDRTATFTFSAAAGVTFQCKRDGAKWTTCTSPTSYTGLSLGSHTFQVRAVSGGSTSTAATYSWTIVPPTPTISSGPANPTISTSATFTFTDSLAGVTYVCKLDAGSFASCASPKSYTGLAVGTHSFEVRAVSAGVQSTSATYSWTIGAPPPTPPPAPTITGKPSDPSASTTAQFSFTDGDASATFLCSIDSASYADCTSPANYLLAVGAHTFGVEAKNAGGTSAPTTYSWTIDANQVKMRLLVISGNGSEQYDFASNPSCSPSPCKGAIQTYLDELGVPYDTMIASQVPDAATLASDLGLNDTVGKYDGIILATGDLGYFNASNSYVSGFTADEWQTLWNYEAKFKVRQVTSDTAPTASPFDYGLTTAAATSSEVDATLTSAGQQLFSYLNPSATIKLLNTYTYEATTTDPSVTPLLTTAEGYVIASTKTYPDGRQNLAITTGNAPWLLHTKLLSYGIVNWLTQGVFLGSRHVTLDAEVDDLLIDGQLWDTTNHVETPETQPGCCYRTSGADFQNLINWQNGIRGSSSQLSQFRLEFAFNGEGAFGDPPNYSATDGSNSIYTAPNPDPLTQELIKDQANFCYINHTYQHQNVDLTTYDSSTTEIQQNQRAATALGLGCYSNEEFVQPDISGLTNDAFQRAAYDSGVRYLITDTSQPGWNNPTPNAGFLLTNTAGTQLLAIPRHPNNLFWNLNTPAQWVDEYNCVYTTGYDSGTPNCDGSAWKFWAAQQSYDQIIDHESNNLLSYLLSWDIDPWMFHQLNVDAYDAAGHTLIGDLLKATFDKYLSYYNLPILNLTQRGVGQLMTQRMAYDASGVDATVVPCQSMTISVQKAASVPVTGSTAGAAETYGGQPIASIPVTPGTPVTVPVSCSN